MIPESAEVRSDQPAPSVDPDDPTLYDDMEGMTTQCSIVHWYSCRLDAGHEGLHSPGRLPQPPATPSLREALERIVEQDKAYWCPADYEYMQRQMAALASSDPGSPSDGGLDVDTIVRIMDLSLEARGDDQHDAAEWILARLSGSPSESEGNG